MSAPERPAPPPAEPERERPGTALASVAGAAALGRFRRAIVQLGSILLGTQAWAVATVPRWRLNAYVLRLSEGRERHL